MRSPGRTLLSLLAATAVAGCLMAPRPLYAQAPDLLPLAQAYTAAWNAHDLDAVLAFFAPDAVVRQRRGDVPPDVWDFHDPQVMPAYLNDGQADGTNLAPDRLQWVTGQQQIASWTAARFAQEHRSAAGQYRTAGGTVGWQYQEFSDPFQRMPGVGPLEGTAEAIVRGGRITVLTLVLSPASVARQRGEADAAIARATATFRAAALWDGRSVLPRGPLRDGPAVAEPTTMAWPLALSGLALLAAITASLRRRQASQT